MKQVLQDPEASQETVPADGVAVDPPAMARRVKAYVEGRKWPSGKAKPTPDAHNANLWHVGSVQIEALSVATLTIYLVKQGGELLAKVFTGLEDAVGVADVFAHVWVPECSDCGELEDQVGTEPYAWNAALRHELDHDGEHSVTLLTRVVE